MKIEHYQITKDYEKEFSKINPEQKNEIRHFLEFWFSDENALTVMTSGSTGKPKPIMIPRKDLIASAQITLNRFQLKPDDNALLCLPTKYIAGKLMLVRALVGNLNLISTTPSLRPLKDIETPIDFAAMTPAQVEESLKYDSAKFYMIRQLIIGGATVSKKLEKALQTLPTECYSTYGMTETVTHIALKKLNDNDQFEALNKVSFETDNQNRLIIHTPHLSTKKHNTNDVVQLIDSKHFNYLGRADNVINSGGVKIHPEIIEKKLEGIIKQRYFITKEPNETLGEQVVLVIEGKNNITIDQLKSVVDKFEVPKRIETQDQFKETETGKIIRDLN